MCFRSFYFFILVLLNKLFFYQSDIDLFAADILLILVWKRLLESWREKTILVHYCALIFKTIFIVLSFYLFIDLCFPVRQ